LLLRKPAAGLEGAQLVPDGHLPQVEASGDKMEKTMATALFMVRASIPEEREAEFNRWYNEDHCPQVLQYRGAVSARRYRALLGEDRYQYMAVYEFEDQPTLERFLESEHFAELKREFDAHFGGVSERARSAYVQVWP
jgi:hypothetical protein